MHSRNESEHLRPDSRSGTPDGDKPGQQSGSQSAETELDQGYTASPLSDKAHARGKEAAAVQGSSERSPVVAAGGSGGPFESGVAAGVHFAPGVQSASAAESAHGALPRPN